MISSIDSSNAQVDLAALLRSDQSTQQAAGQRPKPPNPTEMFENMDSDGDGAVSETEFTSAMEQVKETEGNRPPPPAGKDGAQAPSIEELFAKIDSDSDGQISLDELKADFESRKPEQGGPPPPPQGGSSGPDLTELFSKLDSDSDGQIGESEFKKLFEAMDQISQNQQSGTTYNSTGGADITSLLGYA